MGIRLLDNNMFDDGSIECKNFQVANVHDESDVYICEWDSIVKRFSKPSQDNITEAIKNGERYIIVAEGIDRYEISWD